MKVNYINHKETEYTKAHTDILLNDKYIGYYIQGDDELTYFIEYDNEMYSEECDNEKELTEQIKYWLNESFNNGDLSFDIEKIESFDVPITVAKAYDQNLDYPFAIDVEDGSYFYAEQKERDEDFEKLKSIVPKFSFVEL